MTTNERALSLIELQALSTEELRDIRLRYKERVGAMEGAVESVKMRNATVPGSLGSALRHHRTALGLIKDIIAARNLAEDENNRQVGELYRAAGAFLDDDSDANWDRLHAAYEAMPVPNNERVDA